MRLHAIYRSVGAENRKQRPPGYSKPTCLRSFLRARDACASTGELLFLNDGPIPPDLVAAMQRAGEIVARAGLELHGSYWAAIDLALQGAGPMTISCTSRRTTTSTAGRSSSR
jgi:hypothetical protein